MNAQDELLDAMERLIRRDPARRGLLAHDSVRDGLCRGHLAAAATSLAQTAQRVLLVTGFYIPHGCPPAAETDGPPGTALLAASLFQLGMDVQIATDANCRHAVEVAARDFGLPPTCIEVPGDDAATIETWSREQSNRPGRRPLTHLISLERVGPSHTLDSLLKLAAADANSPLVTSFLEQVPREEWDHCYNMRGDCIDRWTAPLHRIFEVLRSPALPTIGIGDGGNEIGMGSIAWDELRNRLTGPQAGRIPCRIGTTWTVLAGVSNWGGMALAAAVLTLRNRTDLLQNWNAEFQRGALQNLVETGPAVDGVTRLQEATVDGLPFLTYIQIWEGLTRLAESGRPGTPRTPAG